MSAAWDDNSMACKATWTILSSWMNQIKGPFDPAKTPSTPMKELRYWPKSGMDSEIKPGLTFGMAHQFLLLVQDNYVSEKEDPLEHSLTILRKIAAVFGREDATIADLADALDKVARFPGEKPPAAAKKAAGGSK